MYARLVRFSLDTGKQDVAQALAADIAPLIEAQPGCGGVTVFGDENAGEYGLFVLWDTEEHANAAAQVVRPKLDEHLSSQVQGPPDARLFKVISS
jgi:heme-degrading monooxygenase HmoA